MVHFALLLCEFGTQLYDSLLNTLVLHCEAGGLCLHSLDHFVVNTDRDLVDRLLLDGLSGGVHQTHRLSDGAIAM